MSIGFIGAGRAGSVLGLYLKNRGFDIVGYADVRRESAIFASTMVDGIAFNNNADVVATADTIVIAVADDQITPVAEALAAEVQDLKNKTFIHLSGAHTSDALIALREKGARIASAHPVYTFFDKQRQPDRLMFVTEGDESVTELLRTNGLKAFSVATDKKPLYHAAAVVASNCVTALLHISIEMLQEVGFERSEAQTLFKELTQTAVWAISELGGARAITGPVSRGDISTVEMHLDAIKNRQDWVDVYKALAREIVHFAPPAKAEKLKELIQ